MSVPISFISKVNALQLLAMIHSTADMELILFSVSHREKTVEISRRHNAEKGPGKTKILMLWDVLVPARISKLMCFSPETSVQKYLLPVLLQF